MGFVITALSIGLLLTGKSRLSRGCGLAPRKKKPGDEKEDDVGSCPLCGDKTRCDKDELNNKNKYSP